MMTAEPEVPESGAVRAQAIGGHVFRCKALFPQQLVHQLDGCAAVASTLEQHVEDLAFVVDRAPEIHPLAGDPDHHLVEMPAIAWPRTALPQPSRDHRAEFQNPAADALVGQVEPALRKQLLDVAIAQGEAQVKPSGVLDHNRWEPVPAIRNRKHSSQLTAGRWL